MEEKPRTKQTIAILGGTGFVGHVLSRHLTELGMRIKIASRNPEVHRDLLVQPNTSVSAIDVYDQTQLNHFLTGCDVVINLVGILNEKGHKGKGFYQAHVELTQKVLIACKTHHITRLLHMSAMNADPNSKSHYLRTKGEAENLVHAAPDLQVTSFRPSVIFGEHDSFLNRFAKLLCIAPGFFPLPCANSRYAPVYVLDVAQAFIKSLNDPQTDGQRYDLCGPHTYTLKELVKYVAKITHKKRWIIGLGNTASKAQAMIMEFIPGKPFSFDNYLSAQKDAVCKTNGLEQLGITPTPLETIVPLYLK